MKSGNSILLQERQSHSQSNTRIYKQDSILHFQGEADLLYIDGVLYLSQISTVANAPKIEIKDYIGVDLGIVAIATDSDALSYSGETVNAKRQKARITFSQRGQSLCLQADC